MNSWLDYEARFRLLSTRLSDARLDVQTGVAGEHWRIAGGFDREAIKEFDILCQLAGRELTKVWQDEPKFKEILENDDPKIRWYRALKEAKGAYEPGPIARQLDEEGNTNGWILAGSVKHLGDVAANLCLSLHVANPIKQENKSIKEIEPEVPIILKNIKWVLLNWKDHLGLLFIAAILLLFTMTSLITFIGNSYKSSSKINNPKHPNEDVLKKDAILSPTESNIIVPDVSRAKKETLITSLQQFNDKVGLVDVSTLVPGYFELTAKPSSGPYSYACISTKSNFETHYVASVRLAGLEGANVLELQGRDVWFAIDAALDSYFVFESEENWTIWRKLKVERKPDINTLLIYQNGRVLQTFLNGNYVDTLTKLKKPEPGPIGICFKADPQRGGRIHFQKLSIWEFQ